MVGGRAPRAPADVLVAALVAVLAIAACESPDPTEPEVVPRSIAVRSGDGQIGAVGEVAPEPLSVRVRRASDGAPVAAASIRWSIQEGAGAEILGVAARTDSSGVASVQLRLGPDSGSYRVRATTDGAPAGVTFQVLAIADAPVLDGIEPALAAPGQTLELAGSHFSMRPEDNEVLFDGMRGRVLAASATALSVEVPTCLPPRAVHVTVRLGPFTSAARSLTVLDDDAPGNLLPLGGSVALGGDALSCFRLAPGPTGSEYLVVPQSAGEEAAEELSVRLVGLVGGGASAARSAPAAERAPLAGELARLGVGEEASEFEMRLRALERKLPDHTLLRPGDAAREAPLTVAATPQVGDRRTFSVYDRTQSFTTVTAEVKHVGDRAVLYQDVRAPSGGFGEADFRRFSDLFDDPIHETVVSVFGEPSDIDGNGRVIILFTPVVNQLTDPGATGFIAGFFYGLDLTDANGSNRAEIFYSVVPDPLGQFGNARTVSRILEVVPPVLAHEFQHMVHFNQRILMRGAANQEALWLSEALAHGAEHLVGEEFLRRGDAEGATDFLVSNYVRALLYLQDPGRAGAVTMHPPGRLEDRGASWLFLNYVAAHHGGDALLGRITRSTRTGSANVMAETGAAWPRLVDGWSTALYVDGLPGLEGSALDPGYINPALELRQVFAGLPGGYPLKPPVLSVGDLDRLDVLPASGASYLLLRTGSAPPATLNLRLSGGRGEALPASRNAQFTIVRVR